ncbi:hypothetical protein BURK1_02859 [Burkholderiales bacterium]|nr:hypothetical protein BURK1_02859 [Burkholderiales bacterium]
MTRHFASAFLVAAVAATLAGCSITRPSPVKQMYLLEPPAVAAVAQTSPLSARLGTVTVAAPYRERTFVVREADLRFETDFYHEYVVAPAPLIAEAIASALVQSNVFARVIPPGTPPEADLTIDAFVGALYADNRDPKAPGAELAITFYVSRPDRAVAPVWSKAYHRRATLSTVSAATYAAAQSASLGDILGELSRDLAAQRFAR